jgi:uncharacterized protein
MLCPNCQKQLKEIKGKSHYGATIKLNQCENCGGIWFDDWELFELEEKEVKELEEIEAEKFRESYVDDKKGKMCPVCITPLKRVRDIGIPSAITMEDCQNCGGIWMNHGGTTEYKEYQEKKIEDSKKPKVPDELDLQIRKLLNSQQSSDTLGSIGRFFSTPISSYDFKPIEQLGESKEEKQMAGKAGLAADLVTNVLSIFLRSLIR